MKINTFNYYEILPNATIKFQGLIHGAYTIFKEMKSPNSFVSIRYLEPEDIKKILEKRLTKKGYASNTAQAKKNKENWRKLLEQTEKLIEKENKT